MVTATVTQQQEKQIEYPILMTSIEGKLVLFTSYGEGFLLNDDREIHSIGRHSISWAMGRFKPFDGEITLKNQH